MKKKLLLFHPNIRDYRIDFFNSLHDNFDFSCYLFYKKNTNQEVIKQLKFKPKYLNHGFTIKERIFRVGFIKKTITEKPSIILCFEYNYITISILLFSKIFYPTRSVYTICDDSLDVAINSNFLRKAAREIVLRFIDGIILANTDTEKWYNNNYPKASTVVLPIIQDENRIKKIVEKSITFSKKYVKKYNLSDKKILLYVGRLIKLKNIDFIIDVFEKYTSVDSNVVLIIVGDGIEENILKQQAKYLINKSQIIFTGNLQGEALYGWYRIADFLILASKYERFGAVVNEALVAGARVMCSKLAGASNLINSSNGVLFDPYNKNDFFYKLNNVLAKHNQKDGINSNPKSLMPYTFTHAMSKTLSFLK